MRVPRYSIWRSGRLGSVDGRLSVEADPCDAAELRQLLLDHLRRRGIDESAAPDYEMDVRRSGAEEILTTVLIARRGR
jgi:hypothetical protein